MQHRPSSRFFENRSCEYYPCHPLQAGEQHNCLFCYCPLYAFGDRCGGSGTILPNGIKDCSACRAPHQPENYESILSRLAELMQTPARKEQPLPLKIRPLASDELPQAASILRESFQTVADEFGFTRENNPTNGAFVQAETLAEEGRRGVEYFGAFLPPKGAFGEEKRQIGAVALEKATQGLYYLEKLAVLPEYRHKGCGKQLLEYCRIWVQAQGGTAISIGIIDENQRLKQWYAEFGFVQTGTKAFSHLPFTVGFLRLEV